MNEMKRDMIRIQELVGSAFGQTGALVALSDGGHMNPKKLQKTLEQTMEHFESAALELRRLCEQYSPGTGGFSKKSVLPAMDVTGSVEEFGYGWLHITLNTLLPHCRYQNPNWLADTISRLLDGYVACGKELPFYRRALLVIDEHTAIEGRHIFDQDNKGWKAVSNAIKGRVVPDDDQHTLAVALLSTKVQERECCHITLLHQADAHDFLRPIPAIMHTIISIPAAGADEQNGQKSCENTRKTHPHFWPFSGLWSGWIVLRVSRLPKTLI